MRPIVPPMLALLLAGCLATPKPPAPPPQAFKYVPCSALAPVDLNEEAVMAADERSARQLLGNDEVISKLCRTKQK